MTQTIASDLMTAICHLANNVWLLLGHPAQSKKCSFAPGLVEPIEKEVCVPIDAALLRVPSFRRHLLLKRTYVIIVFKVDRKSIFYRTSRHNISLVLCDGLDTLLSRTAVKPIL